MSESPLVVQAGREATVVLLPEDIDLRNTVSLLTSLVEILDAGGEPYILDMTATRSCSVEGFDALVAACCYALRRCIPLSVALPNARMQKHFRLVAAGRPVPDLLVQSRDGSEVADESSVARQRVGPQSAVRPVVVLADRTGESLAMIRVTGLYCDADTGVPEWVAIDASTDDGGEAEALVPACRIAGCTGDRLDVDLTLEAVSAAPTLHRAPDEIGDEVEDALWRHYAAAVSPVNAEPPAPTRPSAHRCRRAENPAKALMRYVVRRTRAGGDRDGGR